MKTNIYGDPVRAGLQDIFNSFMVAGAEFCNEDIPFCPSTNTIPNQIISYPLALIIHKEHMKKGDKNYHIHAFVHFYVDDQKFDSPKSGIWTNPKKAMEILKHFDGIITVDFSTYLDFPDPIKRYNTYRMRAFGKYAYDNGLDVINNARWGTKETWSYCFSGLPTNGILAIGTVASGLSKKENLRIFNDGYTELIHRLKPHTLLIIGSSNYEVIKESEKNGIKIIQFDGDTAKYYNERRKKNE